MSDKEIAILSAALGLFIEYGFHGTPTSKIASEAGVAHGTVFHYFKTKDELVLTLYNSIRSEFHDYISEKTIPSASIKERFTNLFYHSIQWSLQYQREFYFTRQFYYSPHFKQIGASEIALQTNLYRDLYAEALQVGVFKPVPIDLIISLSLSQIIGAHEYLVNAELPAEAQNQAIEEFCELTWAMFTNTEVI